MLVSEQGTNLWAENSMMGEEFYDKIVVLHELMVILFYSEA